MWDLDELYDLIEEIESRKCFIFVVYNNEDGVALDVLDYDTEEQLDGGHFSPREALQYLRDTYV